MRKFWQSVDKAKKEKLRVAVRKDLLIKLKAKCSKVATRQCDVLQAAIDASNHVNRKQRENFMLSGRLKVSRMIT